MESLKPYKNILIGGGIILLIFGGYMIWSNRDVSVDGGANLVSFDTLATDSSVSPQAAAAGQQIISILNDLQRLQIDRSVFENKAFDSLIDYTIATTSEDRGRDDPFAPLPFEFETEEGKSN